VWIRAVVGEGLLLRSSLATAWRWEFPALQVSHDSLVRPSGPLHRRPRPRLQLDLVTAVLKAARSALARLEKVAPGPRHLVAQRFNGMPPAALCRTIRSWRA